ncbi:MAG: RNA pseudouridine synthase [Roseivirga sp.]|nr:RNA pseudouridine synthase [Roseivirga sp.]
MKINFKDLIVYEGDHYIVINKPPFVASLADRNAPVNIQQLAKAYDENLSVCHRLDKDTSGCLLIAKNADAYRHASIQFEKRTIKKVYHAVSNGLHEFRAHQVDAPILALPNGTAKVDRREGKAAQTVFTTQETYRNHSLIECMPVTGRMHQIRVHLAMEKAPLVHDELYRGASLFLSQIKRNFKLKKDTDERPLIKRFALHAMSLRFDNMVEPILVEAPYPKDFAVLVKQLRKYKF